MTYICRDCKYVSKREMNMLLHRKYYHSYLNLQDYKEVRS